MEKSASSDCMVPFRALIVAGGSGTRMGKGTPKQYLKVGRKSVLELTIESFYACPGLKEIRLVCDPDHAVWYQPVLDRYPIAHLSFCGRIRKESVFNGLNDFSNVKSEEIILIHDAARPFTDSQSIQILAKAVHKTGAAVLATPVADTLIKESPKKGEIGEAVNRQGLWAVQTPQGFHFSVIMKAHERFRHDESFTDDSSMVTSCGYPVTIVCGNPHNFKITTPGDLDLAQDIVKAKFSTEARTGFGFDVHAFSKEEFSENFIKLGGVDIPHERRLVGHSDADVGLHALTDALLATIAAGDIGTHFPPSDPQWKGADSSVFLSHATDLIRQRNGEITLLDLTFLCESPKIGPYRALMQEKIAKIAKISPERISIKATTTEKLGFTGRGEGIAAQALASVTLPVS